MSTIFSKYSFYFTFFFYLSDRHQSSQQSLLVFLPLYVHFMWAFMLVHQRLRPIFHPRAFYLRAYTSTKKSLIGYAFTHWIGLKFFRRFRVDYVYSRTQNATAKQRWFHASDPVDGGGCMSKIREGWYVR